MGDKHSLHIFIQGFFSVQIKGHLAPPKVLNSIKTATVTSLASVLLRASKSVITPTDDEGPSALWLQLRPWRWSPVFLVLPQALQQLV